VNKTAASAAQFAKCIFLHPYSCTTAYLPAAREQTITHKAYLSIWHKIIFGYKLRTE